MDDFCVINLKEARNEWCIRLSTILNPCIIQGIKSIFNEAHKICIQTQQNNKYLLTFQNFLSLVPNWNKTVLLEETSRITQQSGCNYLTELLTCVHVIQLKQLTCIRVGNQQKKVDISIPNIETFIHRVYILVARKVYKNAYLFQIHKTTDESRLLQQKYHRELELMVDECIMTAIRESIPTEAIIRAYMEDASVEHEEQITVEPISVVHDDEEKMTEFIPLTAPPPLDNPPETVPSISNLSHEPIVTKVHFDDFDPISSIPNSDFKIVKEPDLNPFVVPLIKEDMQTKFEKKMEDEKDDIVINFDEPQMKTIPLMESSDRKEVNSVASVFDGRVPSSSLLDSFSLDIEDL
jgi:hypothetical protein